MPGYRIYVLDDAGRIRRAHEVLAEHDHAAVAAARSIEPTASLEVWQRARRIYFVEGDDADDTTHQDPLR